MHRSNPFDPALFARWLFTALVWAIFGFLVFPLLIIVPISFSGSAFLQFPPPSFSFRWYESYFGDADWMAATVLSLQIGACVTVLTLALAVPFAFSLTRGLRRWGQLLEKIAMAPMIVPTIVYSVSIYSVYSSLGLVGNWIGIVIAHTVYAFPFATVVLYAGFKGINRDLELAAMGLGASRLTAFHRAVLPQIRPTLITAGFLAFITSFDELVIAMFLVGRVGTLPKKMFDSVRLEIDPTVAAASVVQTLVVVLIMIFVTRTRNKTAA